MFKTITILLEYLTPKNYGGFAFSADAASLILSEAFYIFFTVHLTFLPILQPKIETTGVILHNYKLHFLKCANRFPEIVPSRNGVIMLDQSQTAPTGKCFYW